MNTADTATALAAAERALLEAALAADQADDKLQRAADSGSADGPTLTTLRNARNAARTAKATAEEQATKARAEHTGALAAEAAEEQRQADAEAAEEARLAAEEKARALAESLAGPLAALESARAKADAANTMIAAARAALRSVTGDELVAIILETRTPEQSAEVAALVRASVAAENILAAIPAVASLDPRRPEIRAAKDQIDAMALHAILADVADGVFLLDAGRKLALAGIAKIGAVEEQHGHDPRVARLAVAAAQLLHASAPLPIGAGPYAITAVLGVQASEAGALGLLVGGAPIPEHVSPVEHGRIIHAGRAHTIPALVAERDRVATMERLVRNVATARGEVAQALAAVEELRYSRGSGQWHGDRETREPFLRNVVKAGADFVAEQMAPQMAKRGGHFMVAAMRGGPQLTKIPDLAPALPMDRDPWGNPRPAMAGRTGPAAPPRAQLLAFLGIDDQDHDLVPDFGDVARAA